MWIHAMMLEHENKKNRKYYEQILGIESDIDNIKSKYKYSMLAVHPDKHDYPFKRIANIVSAEINNAYEYLR